MQNRGRADLKIWELEAPGGPGAGGPGDALQRSRCFCFGDEFGAVDTPLLAREESPQAQYGII